MTFNPYTHQLFFILRKTRKADFLDWLENHPNKAARLGLDDVIGLERVKITTTAPPNFGSPFQVLGTAVFITQEQRDFWVSIKDDVPLAWQDDVDGTIRRINNRLDFDDWLASLTPPLYRLEEEEA